MGEYTAQKDSGYWSIYDPDGTNIITFDGMETDDSEVEALLSHLNRG